jgi:hypothetical protein
MMPFNGSLPLFDQLYDNDRPVLPSRLDIHTLKLEHDKMYLTSFEVDRLSRPSYNAHLAQQFAELSILDRDSHSRLDRLRVAISNSLISIAGAVRPSDANCRDIARAR